MVRLSWWHATPCASRFFFMLCPTANCAILRILRYGGIREHFFLWAFSQSLEGPFEAVIENSVCLHRNLIIDLWSVLTGLSAFWC
jgi:hypothetical protein